MHLSRFSWFSRSRLCRFVTDQAKNGRRKKRIFCKSTVFGRPEMNAFVSESALGTSKRDLQNVVVLLPLTV
jgi:hypothetical protein